MSGDLSGIVWRISLRFCLCAVLLNPLLSVSADDNVGATPDASQHPDTEFFEKKIRPVLVRHCYECHSGSSPVIKGNLRVDYREGLRKGGDSGPAINVDEPDSSLILQAVRYQGLEMPPRGKLPDAVIEDLEQWLKEGAFDPRATEPSLTEVAAESFRAVYEDRMNWWAFQSLNVPSTRTSNDRVELHEEIDALIAERLKSESLELAPPAAPNHLLRRLSFFITGLPPVASQIGDDHQSDRELSADDWTVLVDKALNSPHYGERWARHWMDVIRYTDTYGYEWDMPAKGAWRFRDYLIRAFNADIPFNELIREQIAGDLLPTPRMNQELGINESLIGPMFYQLGEKRHGDSSEFNGIHQEMLDNKIDAFGKAFLATTISCARCHDHKLDPVSQRDYYALAGTFFSSRWVSNTVDLPDRQQVLRAQLESTKSQLRNLVADLWLKNLEQLSTESLSKACEQTKPIDFDEPLYLFEKLRSAAAGTASVETIPMTWDALRHQCIEESDRRMAENRGHFAEVVDFRNGVPEGWSVNGEGLRTPVKRGDFVVSLKDQTIVDAILFGGLATNSISPKLNGAVRSPWTKDLGPAHLSFEVAGGEFAARRVVVDNAFLTEKQQYVNSPFPRWMLVDAMGSLTDRHIYVEFATKTSNPNFPPRVGLGGACSEEQAADPRSWFQITRVVKHTAPFSPKPELRVTRQFFEFATPESLADATNIYRNRLKSAVTAWQSDTCADEDVELLNWALKTGIVVNSIEAAVSGRGSDTVAASDQKIRQLVEQYRELEANVRVPETVNGMADIDPPFNYRINIRGDYDQLGDEVPRAAPVFVRDLAGALNVDGKLDLSDSELRKSTAVFNRLQLAELILSPRNPLTARVYVNRVWHWLFGQGLVRTPDDFGHAGDQPVHNQLLDLLAHRFMEHGWSTKYLIREILLTQTWRQSQEVSGAALEIDPNNRLLHHFPVTRLDAESIRDAILAVSGDLDPQLHGPVVYPWRLNEDPQKRLFSGPLDGKRRRSIYTQVSIMEPPRFLQTFNQPAPKLPSGKRDSTNTPAQSLTLLNDPFVLEQARRWAKSMVLTENETPEARIQKMFQRALGRSATPEEVTRWSLSVQQLADSGVADQQSVMLNEELWQVICHAMLNTKEFIYVQ